MSQIIKVVHVLPNASIGGGSKYVYELVEEQKKNSQLRPAILFYNTHGTMLEQFRKLEVPMYPFYMRSFHYPVSEYKKITKTINQYHIVHWHVFIPVLSFFHLSKNVKQFFTHHSVFGTGRITKKTDPIKWYLFKRFINKKIDGVIFNSEFSRKFWYSRNVCGKKTALIYNGVNLNIQESTPVDDETKKFIAHKFVVGTTSNFIGWKRIELLIKSFALFQKNKDDVCLLIVGDGYMKEDYLSLIKDLNLENKVILPGHRLNISSYQKEMNVCVFPSTTETFGLVAVECMNLGKPVIVFNDGDGIVEVVGKDSPNVVSDITGLSNRLDYYYHNQSVLETDKVLFQERAGIFNISKNEKEVMLFYKLVL